jgi:glycosyltransferase involved in cell wall biosynthesis
MVKKISTKLLVILKEFNYMKFTIYTSFYNYLETFDELCESVFSQTYQNWEWLVSDDFSENPEVLIKLKNLSEQNNKVKLINPNYKKEFYWNPPTDKSTGDIFLVLDSDDMMHPKLLEIYKHNFEKFPEVQLISSNSILRHESIKGNLHSFRHINYKNNCNLFEKWKNSVPGEYAIGDCRAWRNNIHKFETECSWDYCCSEDVLKVLKCEEIGKILYIPRTLHTYAHRENSISKAKIYGTEAYDELVMMYDNAEKRTSRKHLNSYHDYYDKMFNETTAFYLSDFNLKSECFTIEYYSCTSTPRDREILKSLYFDQNIIFDVNENTDYLIMKIQTIDDIKYLENRVKIKPNIGLNIEVNESLKNSVDQVLYTNNLVWTWFHYGKFFYEIKF